MTRVERQLLAGSVYAFRHALTCALSHECARDLYVATFTRRRAPWRTVTLSGSTALDRLTALLTYATTSTGKATQWLR